MGKNVTIYLPDEVAQKMETLPEVNWSEICRKAITDYIEARTQTDLTSIITRLKNESRTDFTKGKLVIYEEVAHKLSIEDLEKYASRIDEDTVIARSYEPPGFGESRKLYPAEAKAIAIDEMRHNLVIFKNQFGAKIPINFSDSYVEGAMTAIKDLHKRVKSHSS